LADGSTLDSAKDLDLFDVVINETGNFSPDEVPCAVLPAVEASTGNPVMAYELSKITSLH